MQLILHHCKSWNLLLHRKIVQVWHQKAKMVCHANLFVGPQMRLKDIWAIYELVRAGTLMKRCRLTETTRGRRETHSFAHIHTYSGGRVGFAPTKQRSKTKSNPNSNAQLCSCVSTQHSFTTPTAQPSKLWWKHASAPHNIFWIRFSSSSSHILLWGHLEELH